jgi:hypothetical protein
VFKPNAIGLESATMVKCFQNFVIIAYNDAALYVGSIFSTSRCGM